MNAISTTQTNAAAVQTVSNSLMQEFVDWIDRSEATTRAYTGNLKMFAAWLRYTGIEAPRRDDIIRYRKWLGSEHKAIRFAPDTAQGWAYRNGTNGRPMVVTCKAATIALYIRSVCQFFRWTASTGRYPNVADGVHAPKLDRSHKKDALTAAEVCQIESSINDNAAAKTAAAAMERKDTEGRVQRATEQGLRLSAMYLLAVNAGLRTVEISRANVRDLVTRGGQTWLVVWGKGHAEADTKKALAPEVAAAVFAYLAERSDGAPASAPLFVSTGNRSYGKRIASTTISTMLKRALQEAGYDDERLTAHSLRHTAGTAVYTATRDLYATQRYMRHANPATTEIYLHMDDSTQDAATAATLYQYYHAAAAV